MPHDPTAPAVTRRWFLGGLAAGAATAAAGTAADPPAAPKLTPEAEAQFQAVLARHGPRLSAGQKDEVRKLLADLTGAVTAVRAFPLADADEPALAFRPFRKPGGAT